MPISAEIDIAEFKDLCLHILHLPLTEHEVTEVFETVDQDKSGSCSAAEMKVAIESATASEGKEQLAKAMAGREDEGDVRENTRLVALVAHNNMKPAMMAFVAKHREFFKTVQIVTTGSTGGALEKKLGLKIARKVASGPLGGDQEIGALVTTGDVAVVFFFIDPLSAHPHESDIIALVRICEVHNTCLATNPATGDVVVHAFLTRSSNINALRKKADPKREESDVVAQYKRGQQAVISNVADSSGAKRSRP